jgi:uncharacterized protein (TIGR00251 family)
MRIKVRVKPNSRTSGIEKQADGSYLVRVNASPVEGKANEAVVKLLADFFGRPRSAIEIVRGFKARDKLVEIK